MITVVGTWEPGFREYEQIIEYRMWKQSIAAFDVDRWLMVGQGPDQVVSFESFETMADALATIPCHRVFLVPEQGEPLEKVYRPPDHALIFGHADESLMSYVEPPDAVAHIATPKPVDMFAACVLPMVMTWP